MTHNVLNITQSNPSPCLQMSADGMLPVLSVNTAKWICEQCSWCAPINKILRGFSYLFRQIFRIGTVRYAEGLWRMRRHGPVIAHCTDSEDFPLFLPYITTRLQHSFISLCAGMHGRRFVTDCWHRAKITMMTDKAVTVRQSDGTDSRLFINQLQLGKYTIRHAL